MADNTPWHGYAENRLEELEKRLPWTKIYDDLCTAKSHGGTCIFPAGHQNMHFAFYGEADVSKGQPTIVQWVDGFEDHPDGS